MNKKLQKAIQNGNQWIKEQVNPPIIDKHYHRKIDDARSWISQHLYAKIENNIAANHNLNNIWIVNIQWYEISKTLPHRPSIFHFITAINETNGLYAEYNNGITNITWDNYEE